MKMHCAFLSTQTEYIIYGGEVPAHGVFYHGAYDEGPCGEAYDDGADMLCEAAEEEGVRVSQVLVIPLPRLAAGPPPRVVAAALALLPPGYPH